MVYDDRAYDAHYAYYFVLVSDEGFLCQLKALFDSLPPEDYKNGVLVLGGDGRYFNKEAAQVFKLDICYIFGCPLLPFSRC